MTMYSIRWEIDLEADSPEEAAALARAVQLDPLAQVGFFETRLHDDRTSPWVSVDLTP